MRNTSITRLTTARAPLFLALATASATLAADPITDAISNGTPSLDTRYRYEQVDQENFQDDARASTLRVALGYETGDVQGFKGVIQTEHVTAIGPENYNSTLNNRTSRPVVADPTETELNLAYLQYSGLADTSITFGRQRLKLDNDRFIGNVGWRQNEQTFDGTTLVNQSLPDTTLTAGYLYNANRIFSDASPNGDLAMRTGILNARYEGLGAGSLSAYGYLLSFPNNQDASTQTYGLRYAGSAPISDSIRALFNVEYAYQSDYDDNSQSFDHDYYRLEAGADLGGVTLKAGQEVLGSDDGNVAFQTPLATLHAFNGFTDQFLSTPNEGLSDTYASVSGAVQGLKLMAIYHEFESDEGSIDYGSEAAIQAVYPVNSTYSLGAKFASYDADNFSQDTDKGWVWVQASF